MFFKNLKARIAALELQSEMFEKRYYRLEKRNAELEDKIRKLSDAPQTDELTKDQIEAMERQLYEWQNGPKEDK